MTDQPHDPGAPEPGHRPSGTLTVPGGKPTDEPDGTPVENPSDEGGPVPEPSDPAEAEAREGADPA